MIEEHVASRIVLSVGCVLTIVGLVYGYVAIAAAVAARRERRRLLELCRLAHAVLECPGPWLGRACNVCRQHPENAS